MRSGIGPVQVRVEVLGPLRLVVAGHLIEVPGPKRRAVLALLARAQGRVVAVDELVEAAWQGEAPATARASLHSHISRLRGHLGPAAGRLQTCPDGYRLELGPGELDAAHAQALLGEARAATPERAYALLEQARTLWRGTAMAELGAVIPLAAWSTALEELRHEVEDEFLASAVAAGHAVVGAAREAVAAQPLRETTVRALMRALAASGQASEALREGYEFRHRLAGATGLDPSPALRDLEREIAAAAHPGPTPPRAQVTLIGRDAEVAALRRMLDTAQLVTVVGPGRVGKTSLATRVARQLDEVTVLPLAPVTDPAAVPYALASALGLRTVRGDLLAACAVLLDAGPGVLVVDNCEHLRDAVRELVSTLLARCPRLRVLATSREPLALPAERQLRLAPLALPAPERGRGPIERVASVAVFLHRAQRVRPGLTTGPAQLRLVSEIVRRLDGLPLAIELAAGRLSSLSLTELHERLDRALDLLGDGSRSPQQRHRTLRATIEWSYLLLAGEQQHLFRHLAVFPDGFDLTTAEWLAGEVGLVGDPAGLLAHLVEASMVQAQSGSHGTRYRMLDTLRRFGLDQLAAAGEHETAHVRMLTWATGLATWIGATEASEREPDADAVLRRELGNLRAAWRLARDQDDLDAAVTLVVGLFTASSTRDLIEVWAWARELADDRASHEHPRRAVVLGMASNAAWQRGELADAESLGQLGLSLAGDDESRWLNLTALATVALSQVDYGAAIQHALAAADCAPRAKEIYLIAAVAAAYAGDLDQARQLNERLAAAACSPTMRALHAYACGEIANVAGQYDQAAQHYQRAVVLARTTRADFVAGIATVGLVSVRAAAGLVVEALTGYRELVDYWERTGMWLQQWTTLRNLARLLRERGDHETALFLESAADLAADSPAVAGGVWPAPPAAALAEEVEARVRARAAAATSAQVLATAREAIARHLAATQGPQEQPYDRPRQPGAPEPPGQRRASAVQGASRMLGTVVESEERGPWAQTRRRARRW